MSGTVFVKITVFIGQEPFILSMNASVSCEAAAVCVSSAALAALSSCFNSRYASFYTAAHRAANKQYKIYRAMMLNTTPQTISIRRTHSLSLRYLPFARLLFAAIIS